MNIEGTMAHFNYGPKGGYEALILATTKGLAQINFDPEQSSALALSLKPGMKLNVKVGPMPHTKDAPHSVYELQSLKVLGKALKLDASVEVTGTVARLNHSRHGEVNGALLDTGDFIHLKPHGARALNLGLGQTITVTGTARPLFFGIHRAIDVEKVSGVNLSKLEQAWKATKKAAKKAARKTARKQVK